MLEAGPCPSSHSRLLQGRMSHFDTPEDGFDGKQMALKWDEPAKYGGWGRVFGDLDMIKG